MIWRALTDFSKANIRWIRLTRCLTYRNQVMIVVVEEDCKGLNKSGSNTGEVTQTELTNSRTLKVNSTCWWLGCGLKGREKWKLVIFLEWGDILNY